MGFLNVDWKNFNLNHVLQGCTSLLKAGLNLESQYVKDVAKYRLSFCNSCSLNDGSRCFRDWDDKDREKLEGILVSKYGTKVVDNETYFKELQLYIRLYKTHTIHKGKVYIGCGCNIKCKVFSLESSCPANKWQAVKDKN